MDPGERPTLKPQGQREKQRASIGLLWELHLFAHLPQRHQGSSLDPYMGHQNVNLKYTAKYLSRKIGSTRDWHRSAIRGLRPWQATRKSRATRTELFR